MSYENEKSEDRSERKDERKARAAIHGPYLLHDGITTPLHRIARGADEEC